MRVPCYMIAVATLMLSGCSEEAAEQTKQAWEKTKEATKELGREASEASAEAWETTKQTSKEYADKAAEKSREAWDATKETSKEYADLTAEKSREAWEAAKGFRDESRSDAGDGNGTEPAEPGYSDPEAPATPPAVKSI